MATSSKFGKTRLLDYAWSAWAALGLSSWSAAEFAASVDIESLLLLTGSFADEDARLRDESIDWCASNLGLVSRSRLAHLVRGVSRGEAWPTYAATLQAATKQSWPGAGEPVDWSPTRKSKLPERSAGAALALRCRGLMGTTARSEIVRVLLLDESGRPWEIRDLVTEVGYTKRGVAEAVEGLRLAGVVKSIMLGNARAYSLARPEEMVALLGPLPRVRTSQRAVIRVLIETVRATEQLANSSARVRVVEEARVLRELEPELHRVDPRVTIPGSDRLDFVRGWCALRCDEALSG